ncbi:MAG TPA: hypothetical protein VIH30_11340 [Aquirhabdus sp.]
MKIKCNCKNDGRGNSKGAEFQNATYGDGVRIATQKLTVQGRAPEYRCTVCGANHSADAAIK